MSETSWNYNISQGYTANLKPFKPEVKSSLTRTGELAIQQNSQLNYSQQQMFQKGGPSDMQNQLKLLKSKMTQQQFLQYNDIDRQADNLSSELSTLNSRLQNKQTYQSNHYDQSAAIPRNRAQNKISQMRGPQTIETNSPQSQNSTNITSFVQKDNHIQNQQINHLSNNYQSSLNKPRESTINQPNYSQNINQSNYLRTQENQPNYSQNINQSNYLRTEEKQPKDLSSRIDKQFSQFQEKQDQRSLYEPSMYEITPGDKKQVNRLNKPSNQDISPQQYKKQNKFPNQNNYQESPQQPQQVNKPQERNLFIQQQKPYQIPQDKQVINTRQQAPTNPQLPANQTFQIDEISAVAKQKPQLPQISEDEDQELITCPEGCGRQFNQGAMLKHKKICKKVFQTKRKQFNSKAHRIIEEAGLEVRKNSQTEVVSAGTQQSSILMKKDSVGDPKWKKQSEQFRQMISTTQNNQSNAVQNNALEDDYVQCGSCGRKFNENAASRHIPGCKTRTLKNANR